MSGRGAQQRLLLLPTLALLTTITAVVSSLGAPLVPSIAETYDVRLTTAQWSLTATLLIGSVAMQGVGMALLPLAIAVARDALVGEPMNRAIALLSVTTVAGAGLGFPLTALVAEVGGLHAAYVLGTVLAGATLVMAWRYLPGSAEGAPMRVDWAGAALLSGGLLAVLLAVSEGEVWAWSSPLTLGVGAAGLALLLLAGWWTLRSASPLVDLRMAVRPGLAAPNLVVAAYGGGDAGFRATLLTVSAIFVVAATGAVVLDRRTAGQAAPVRP